jgi:hypothetical protein
MKQNSVGYINTIIKYTYHYNLTLLVSICYNKNDIIFLTHFKNTVTM